MGRIAMCRNRIEDSLFTKYGIDGPMNIRLSELLPFRAHSVLCREAGISTVSDLLKYTSVHGWDSLNNLRSMGKTTYSNMINALQKAHFIIIHKDDSIELSPELAIWVV